MTEEVELEIYRALFSCRKSFKTAKRIVENPEYPINKLFVSARQAYRIKKILAMAGIVKTSRRQDE